MGLRQKLQIFDLTIPFKVILESKSQEGYSSRMADDRSSYING